MHLPIDYAGATWMERKAARLEYVRRQHGRCAYCGRLLQMSPSQRVLTAKINWALFPANFTKYPVHLHHSHDTGMTIGAVHARCNAYLWQFEGE